MHVLCQLLHYVLDWANGLYRIYNIHHLLSRPRSLLPTSDVSVPQNSEAYQKTYFMRKGYELNVELARPVIFIEMFPLLLGLPSMQWRML